MKTINTYIQEKLVVNNTIEDNFYKYQPKDKNELVNIIQKKIEKEGLGTKDKPLNLNDINTSEITDMSNLFNAKYGDLMELSDNGHFDISDWDVSNVENMRKLFVYSSFNGDISNWNIKNVTDMHWMFRYSEFNGNISGWDVSKVRNMSGMFEGSDFNGDISDWDVSNVEDMSGMFINCPLKYYPPKWYKE